MGLLISNRYWYRSARFFHLESFSLPIFLVRLRLPLACVELSLIFEVFDSLWLWIYLRFWLLPDIARVFYHSCESNMEFPHSLLGAMLLSEFSDVLPVDFFFWNGSKIYEYGACGYFIRFCHLCCSESNTLLYHGFFIFCDFLFEYLYV